MVQESGYQDVKDYRCARCNALLFKGTSQTIGDVLEIKCRRCSAINVLRPAEPRSERPRSARSEQSDAEKHKHRHRPFKRASSP
ncbi:MAG: Com family DNA-binding transcriptional regulator [Pseudomonadota bacterium]